MNGMRQASSAPISDVPRSISGDASSSASVMPTARPVIAQPMPRLRFSNGDWRVITVRSLE